MIEHELQEKRKAALHNRNEFESRLARIRAHEKKTKERYARGEPLHKRQVYLSRVNQVNFADMRLIRKQTEIRLKRKKMMTQKLSTCLMTMRAMTS